MLISFAPSLRPSHAVALLLVAHGGVVQHQIEEVTEQVQQFQFLVQFHGALGQTFALDEGAHVLLGGDDGPDEVAVGHAGREQEARVIFDKFHIVRHLSEALDAVRRAAKDRAFIKGQRSTLLSHREHLSFNGRRSLAKLLKANKRLHTAYLLIESCGQLWGYQTESGARTFFTRWKQRLILPPGEQGQPQPHGGAQQQDPCPPTAGLRLP